MQPTSDGSRSERTGHVGPANASARVDGAPQQTSLPQSASRLGWRRWIVAGAVLLVVGIFGAGFGIGWATHGLVGPPALPDTTVNVISAPTAGPESDTALPDVRGLLLVDAQQALADTGLSPENIEVVSSPSAQPEGTITRQDPIGGTIAVSAVTLYVSVPGVVPEVIGTSTVTAVQTFIDLGVRVVQRQIYDPAVVEGTVIGVDPPAGSPLPTQVTLTVSGPASSVYLSALEPAESRCSAGEADINGMPFAFSVICSAGRQESTQVYLLDRRSSGMEGVIGIVDQSEPGYAADVTIVGDGQVLFTASVGYGQSVPFSVRTVGVLRLELRVSSPTPDSSGRVALGDARVIGGPDDIAVLADE